jgi:hypothetical protein
LRTEALEAFEEAARDLDVEGSGWTAAEAQAALEDSMAAHVHELTQRKVEEVSAPWQRLWRLCYVCFGNCMQGGRTAARCSS